MLCSHKHQSMALLDRCRCSQAARQCHHSRPPPWLGGAPVVTVLGASPWLCCSTLCTHCGATTEQVQGELPLGCSFPGMRAPAGFTQMHTGQQPPPHLASGVVEQLLLRHRHDRGGVCLRRQGCLALGGDLHHRGLLGWVHGGRMGVVGKCGGWCLGVNPNSGAHLAAKISPNPLLGLQLRACAEWQQQGSNRRPQFLSIPLQLPSSPSLTLSCKWQTRGMQSARGS